MKRILLCRFKIILPGVAVLAALVAAGCTSGSFITPTTPANTLNPTFTSNPVQAASPAPAPTLTFAPTPTPIPSLYTINIRSKFNTGNYLVDERGMTLYYTVSDRPGYSNLPDETLSSWPVFYTSNIIVPQPLNAGDFGIYTRDNNVKQTTYKGYPLYYYFQDKTPGDTLGSKSGGVWFVIDPDKFIP